MTLCFKYAEGAPNYLTACLLGSTSLSAPCHCYGDVVHAIKLAPCLFTCCYYEAYSLVRAKGPTEESGLPCTNRTNLQGILLQGRAV
jgi:hypothetical protein